MTIRPSKPRAAGEIDTSPGEDGPSTDRIDPSSPYHKPRFAEDKRFVFFCAGGLRSALAAQAAQHMGLKPVAHIRGGFGAWKNAGGPVEAQEPPKPKA